MTARCSRFSRRRAWRCSASIRRARSRRKRRARGIPTWPDFFDSALAKRIRAEFGAVKVVTANNMFAHADGLPDILDGMASLLDPHGIFVFEVSYLLDVIERNLFDTIYHEHLSYHSVKPLVSFMQRHGLELVRVQRVESHGGSIRCYAAPAGSRAIDPSVAELIAQEEKAGLYETATYTAYLDRINALGAELRGLIGKLRAGGAKVAGFGAPGEGDDADVPVRPHGKGPRFHHRRQPAEAGALQSGPICAGGRFVRAGRRRRGGPITSSFSPGILRSRSSKNTALPPGGRKIHRADTPTPNRMKSRIISEIGARVAKRLGESAREFEGKSVLITGANGFLGQYFLEAFIYLNQSVFKTPCEIVAADSHITNTTTNDSPRRAALPLSFAGCREAVPGGGKARLHSARGGHRQPDVLPPFSAGDNRRGHARHAQHARPRPQEQMRRGWSISARRKFTATPTRRTCRRPRPTTATFPPSGRAPATTNRSGWARRSARSITNISARA